jgi:hypothetical protein
VNFPEGRLSGFLTAHRASGRTIAMWQLEMKAKTDKDWVHVGTFSTVTEAARRICELDGDHKHTGLFLEFHVDTTDLGTDDEAFRVFHRTGKRALYGIKRSRPN